MANKTHIEEIEAQAALFALGGLPPEETAKFKQRLSAGCPLCNAELQDCEQVTAALALSVSEVAPPPSLKARLLASIEPQPTPAQPAGSLGTIVRPGDTEWESPVAGVQLRKLLGRKTMLVRMAPGASLPAHEHRHAEQCLVLEGSISHEGQTARAGDFTYMPAGSTHSDLHSPDGCLLLITYT